VIFDYISINKECEVILETAQKKLFLSHRAIHKTIKIARTIADIENNVNVEKTHILEALHYRAKKYFIQE
jgi:magnesium chelatase family protein